MHSGADRSAVTRVCEILPGHFTCEFSSCKRSSAPHASALHCVPYIWDAFAASCAWPMLSRPTPHILQAPSQPLIPRSVTSCELMGHAPNLRTSRGKDCTALSSCLVTGAQQAAGVPLILLRGEAMGGDLPGACFRFPSQHLPLVLQQPTVVHW